MSEDLETYRKIAMPLNRIRGFPTSISEGGKRYHESVLRSYQIVQKVKQLLAEQCPHSLLLELITDMENAPNKECEEP